MSRISSLCEKLIEACWLAAIIMAPLFFNVYSSRTFEPDKTSLVRTLALVMLAAWLVLRAEQLRTGPRRGSDASPAAPLVERLKSIASAWSARNPLIFPTLGLVAAYLISTAASISPSISLWGSYTRMQGLYSTLSYIVIFLLAVSTLRSHAQVDRAITVALINSFPIAFYGIIQHFFLDPLPWGGDVTTRVASNMGNSIFVGAYLIMVIPLALGRLIEQTRRMGRVETVPALYLYPGIAGSIILLIFAWIIPFELGAKRLIEGGLQNGKLTPEMLAASQTDFTIGLIISLAVVAGWWLVGVLLNKRPAVFLLTGLYILLLTLQGLTLLFTQSRGPEIGIIAGLFTFALLYALVRIARRAVLGTIIGAAAVLLVLLAALNLLSSTVPALQRIPYVSRLGQIFETESGTGKVRVLIWQGALQLVLPHAPLWSPTSGDDALNSIRPLIGYGPETLFVSYSAFYPPELANIEQRNATPDRAHNETFDALTTIGLLGFAAENIVFLTLFYLALKWLGLVNNPRERNLLILLWYGGGILAAVAIGLAMGWHFIGVGLPAGMLAGLFLYLVGFALLREREIPLSQDPARSLLIIVFVSAIVAHFAEIHFGIAIVSTRTYFWFLAALLVFVGTRLDVTEAQAAPALVEIVPDALPARVRRRKPARSGARPEVAATSGANKPSRPRAVTMDRAFGTISTTPLLAMAFIGGLILATMGFAYITTNNLKLVEGQSVSALSIISSALTLKDTTAGYMTSPAMVWLFAGSFLVMLLVSLGEWGWDTSLPIREWIIAVGLFIALVLVILTSFLLYHILLIGSGDLFGALIATVTLFVVFMLILTVVIALTLAMDERTPQVLLARPTNVIIAPTVFLIAILLAIWTNVYTVQADMIYKRAFNLATGNTLPEAIALYQQTIQLQPSQDYYFLFLGRAYLDYAQTVADAKSREDLLQNAQASLLQARRLNPLNTDHSANLGRLHQAWATLETTPPDRDQQFKEALGYYADSLRLAPHTVHLYDQYAQALLGYADLLDQEKNGEAAAQNRRRADELLAQSSQMDPQFCLTPAVAALATKSWDEATQNALNAYKLAQNCSVFDNDTRQMAAQALARAGDLAVASKQGDQFAAQVEQAATAMPSVDLDTVLVNYYSKAGQMGPAIKWVDAALKLIPASDETTQKQYTDFRQSLLNLQQAQAKVAANPNDGPTHLALADLYLARNQADLAIPEYIAAARLLPNDYQSHRRAALLLIKQDRLAEANDFISAAGQLAPEGDRAFWQKLSQAVSEAQNGQKQNAAAALQELIKGVDSKDTFTLDALNALLGRLQSG